MTTYLPVITSDITRKEAAIFIPLVVLVIYLGVNPSIMFEDIQQASILLLQSLVNSLNTKA
jgi:NADH:ubiquinone oxidoreductase subunit 4 (subunit M)